MSDARDAGYDDFLDAAEADEPFYLESPSDNAWLPPMKFDPETGESELTEQPLPRTGEILTHTTINVATPDFVDDAPYVVAIAQFGPVKITGQVHGIDHADVEIGQEVELDVDRTETTDERVVIFRPT